MNQPLVTKEGQRGDNSPSFEAKQEVADSTGKVLAIVAFGISCVALGMLLRADAVLDAKLAAAVAPANEVARTAAQNAKLAEDRANKMAAMLEARGLIKLENH